ncbi:branched-chain amino acid ABC transporter, permease protein [Roseibium sp. TrichSKD4]|uniref:urea ABC transporter permease subunit UrtB n=1 Tax=Roseibium sp. TrichSKD4 TaxID=744980 RepID=UPI0001E56DEA|nr:urea ABC transporter permease subunit UrtB [Roseibium sp. TrichSKD4]EFO31985.1 branched-chain amino acid ABC transporter, permease protein [Roseibium sp. TrichSKD4]
MLRFLATFILVLCALGPAQAQDQNLQYILQDHHKAVERASRKTIDPLLKALADGKLPAVPGFLDAWRNKNVWMSKEDGQFYFLADPKADPVEIIDIETGEALGTHARKGMKQLKPNSGVRTILASALVEFQLKDPDLQTRTEAVLAIERGADAAHLPLLQAAAETEPNSDLKLRMSRLVRLLTIRFSKDTDARIATIKSFASDTSVDVRSALNPLLETRTNAAPTLPDTINLARRLVPGQQFSTDEAYDLLVKQGLAQPRQDLAARDAILIENIVDGRVGDAPVSTLSTEEARDRAYQKLVQLGQAPALVTRADVRASLDEHVFYEEYLEPDPGITTAALATLDSISNRVDLYATIDLGLDGLSLASIYFLAAIGLAITFGVMGVINMAHGEFIMIGAYTGYVVQQVIPDYTTSIIVALPLAFILAFAAGVALERSVIRHLRHRPLETLLATFGVSIALQQLAKNIFGTQARPLTAPAWLDGSWIINDIISISMIRIAIFALALAFLGLLIFILTKTRFGLEVRAVTQNPRMASSMGINPERINMLTFGLGSGIAGIAGVAIGLFAKVTSELGSAYIVQSFMTVVVGGVGNIWGTLAGAGMIGSLQKFIEWLNPSNTLAAQTYMIIFIIIFIQFRPKGIIALKGRAAGD